MTTKEQKHYINYLVERVNASDLENRAMKLVLQDFLDKQNDYNEGMREMKADLDALKKELLEKNRRLKSADRKIADLTAKLKFAEADIQKSE